MTSPQRRSALRQGVSRRGLLRAGTVGGLAVLGGCLDSTGADSDDTTAPPNVKTPDSSSYERGDGLSETARQRSISVDTTPFEDPTVGFDSSLSHVTEYSYESIDVRLDPQSISIAQLDDDTDYVVEALAYEYLTDTVVGSGESEPFSPGSMNGQTDRTVEMSFYQDVLERRLSYTVFYRHELLPGYRVSDRLFPDTILTATDPFEVTPGGIQSAPAEQERTTETIDYSNLTTEDTHPSRGTYTRYNVEGGYHVFFSPETPWGRPDIATEIPFYVPKTIYDRWKSGDRPTRPEPPATRTDYVTESFERGLAAHFADVVETSAWIHGAIGDEDLLEFVATFVQSLPYALDSISTGYRDYSRYPAETLVDARGDCVDTSILLAAALLGSSLECEVGFFSYDPSATDGPAGHLAVAVSPDTVALPGPDYRYGSRTYSYLEPTGFFEPGRVPSGIAFKQGAFHPIEQPKLE